MRRFLVCTFCLVLAAVFVSSTKFVDAQSCPANTELQLPAGCSSATAPCYQKYNYPSAECLYDDFENRCRTFGVLVVNCDTATCQESYVDDVKFSCGGAGGGTCGGTRGSCNGSCPSGQTCRAPSVPGNGDACSCHGSGGGDQYVCTKWENTCRKGTSCTGNEINGPLPGGCGGCKSTQVCCSQRTCTTIKATDPVGDHYYSGCDVSNGWSCDETDFNTPVRVDFYADGLGAAHFLGSATANKAAVNAGEAAGIAARCGGHSNRRFTFTTPQSLKDGKNHQIYVQAADIDPGDNVLLPRTPRVINCAPPPLSCTGFIPSNNPTIAADVTTYVVSALGVTNADSVDFQVGSVKSGIVQHTYPGVKQADGKTWRATINFAAYHNNDVGPYNVDVMMDGLAGTKLCGGADFIRNMTPTFSSLVIKNGSGTNVG